MFNWFMTEYFLISIYFYFIILLTLYWLLIKLNSFIFFFCNIIIIHPTNKFLIIFYLIIYCMNIWNAFRIFRDVIRIYPFYGIQLVYPCPVCYKTTNTCTHLLSLKARLTHISVTNELPYSHPPVIWRLQPCKHQYNI